MMHLARKMAARVPAIIPLGCFVDGLFFTGPDQAVNELLAHAKAHCYPHSREDCFQLKKATWKQVPRCEQVSGNGRAGARPILCNWKTVQEGRDEAALERLICEMGEEGLREKYVKIIADTNPVLDRFQILVVLAVLLNGGGLVVGAAGTGKSEVLRTIRDILRSEDRKVTTCAYTHAACRLVGGETVAHLTHLGESLRDGYFLIDEIGLLPLSTLGVISKWTAIGARFCCFGDFQGQFEPFQDRWKMDSSLHEFSGLMQELCGGLHITLTQYRRGKDPHLFATYLSLYGENDVNLQCIRQRYPSRVDPHEDPLVLTVSHSKRMRVNAKQNQRIAPPGALLLEWEGDDPVGTTMMPQSMRVWEGMTLIGCPRGSGKQLVVQGVLYTIRHLLKTHAVLEMNEDYRNGRADETVEVPIDCMCSQLRMTHAMCYYTVQGRTVKERHVLLLDTDHPHFSVRALIVGMSRATHGQYVHIGDDESEQLFDGRLINDGLTRRTWSKNCETL